MLRFDTFRNVLNRFEPRISNVVTTATVYPDTNEMNSLVQYDITGLPAPTQKVEFNLQPAR